MEIVKQNGERTLLLILGAAPDLAFTEDSGRGRNDRLHIIQLGQMDGSIFRRALCTNTIKLLGRAEFMKLYLDQSPCFVRGIYGSHAPMCLLLLLEH